MLWWVSEITGLIPGKHLSFLYRFHKNKGRSEQHGIFYESGSNVFGVFGYIGATISEKAD
jgi:hypothetical protein